MLPDSRHEPLPRTLGFSDLVLLMLVAVVNINLVPGIALYGRTTLVLWLMAFCAFFVPQAIAVLALARRYPGEGGVYLWARELFGDFHGFMSGWCYWTNNLFYIPMQLVYAVGVLAFASRGTAQGLASEKWFIAGIAFSWLVLMTVMNVLGLRLGKLLQNLGAVATAATVLFLGVTAALAPAESAPVGGQPFTLGSLTTFSVMCLAFVGVELASTMGSEMRRPERDLRPAVFTAGALVLLLYLAVTLALLRLVPSGELGALQGLMQAIEHGAERVGMAQWVAPVAVLLAISLGGSVSAWFAGAARIPFVVGLERTMPLKIGSVHPRWASPHVALIFQALLSGALLAFTLVGSSLNEAYQVFLKTTVVIQLIPFIYMFAGLMKLKDASSAVRGAGFIGLLTTLSGLATAFVPGEDVTDVAVFETKMVLGCAVTLGSGLLLHARTRLGGQRAQPAAPVA